MLDHSFDNIYAVKINKIIKIEDKWWDLSSTAHSIAHTNTCAYKISLLILKIKVESKGLLILIWQSPMIYLGWRRVRPCYLWMGHWVGVEILGLLCVVDWNSNLWSSIKIISTIRGLRKSGCRRIVASIANYRRRNAALCRTKSASNISTIPKYTKISQGNMTKMPRINS